MKNEASHSEFRGRTVRYLSGEMGSDECRRFEQEMAGDEEKQRIFGEYTSIWSGVDRLAAQQKYDLDAEWEQFSGKIELEQTKGQRSGNTDLDEHQDHRTRSLDIDGKVDDGIQEDKTGVPPVRAITRRAFAWRIAAVFVAGLAGLAGWFLIRNNISYEQLAVQQGTEVIELSDGSVITLNAGSRLKYNMDDPDQRNVILRGEAFFEIARDPGRPFIIEAGSAMIQVLGTSFNVNAYEENEVVEVTVATGLVSMAAKGRMAQQIILNPGNAGIYDKEAKKLELISSADPNATAWKTRKLVFSETPLGEVVKVISHVYNTEVQLANDSLSACPITVSFQDQELGAVLNVIASTLDLQMERRGGAVVLTGEGCN